MEPQVLKPSSRFLGKQILIISLVTVAIAAFGIIIGAIITSDDGPGWVFSIVFLILAGAFWIIGVLLSGPYYRSLRYEIRDDEVVVHVGIWTKSVKHVPYRTVTNIKAQRGLLDRFLFNIGTLNIQTAGMSGSTGAEESLVGLTDVQELYEVIATKLRQFRSGMTPTAAGEEIATPAIAGDTLEKILAEVSQIRRSLEKRES